MGPTIRIDDMPAMPGSISASSTAQLVSSYAPILDPAWRHVDAAGHFHAVSTDESDQLPTLRAEERRVPCDGSCNGVCRGAGSFATDYFCRLCSEQLTPGAIPGPHTIEVGRTFEWSGEVVGDHPEWFAMVGKSVTVREEWPDGHGPIRFGIAIVCAYDSGLGIQFVGSGPLATTEPAVGRSVKTGATAVSS